MRRFLLLICLLFCISYLQSQEIIFHESFDLQPSGWELTADNWSFGEGKLEYSMNPVIIDPFTVSAISPLITLGDNVGELTINHQAIISDQWYVNMSISVLVDDSEFAIFTNHVEDGQLNDGNPITSSFLLSEFAGQQIRLKLSVSGDSNWMLMNWYINEITLKTPYSADLAVSELQYPVVTGTGEVVEYSVKVQNRGTTPQQNYNVSIKNTDGEILASTSENTPLPPFEEREYTFHITHSIPGTYRLSTYVESVSDTNEPNDQIYGHDIIVNPFGIPAVFLWDNDNDFRYSSGADRLSSEYEVEQALSSNNLPFQKRELLPTWIMDYDIIFVMLGFYDWCED